MKLAEELDVKKEELIAKLTSLKNEGFVVLMDLSAVDYRTETKVIYFLHNPTTYERIRVCIMITRDEHLPSCIPIWEGANWYERELYDMFGIHFDNHPDLTRILMPDDWKGHPMLKDYALTEEPVAFKHGVTPKIPSEIIPNVR